MANNNQIYKMSNAGGFKSLARYWDMLAGNTTWNPYTPEGSYYELAKYVVPTGGVSQVIFPVPTGYRHLQIRGAVLTSGATNPTWVVNNDSSSTRKGHHLWGYGTGVAANDQSGTVYWNYNPSSSYPSAFVMDWLDYSSTTKYKTMRTLAGSNTNGGTDEIAMWSGLYMSLSPITSITLDANGVNFSANSTFTLIGIK